MIFRCAAESELPRLKEIFGLFGDDAEYIDCFFSDMFSSENFLVAEENGEPASMMALFPCTLVLPEGRFRISYLYGFCTAKEYRGAHIGTSLLKYASVYCRSRGDAGIALLPAEGWLTDYYKKHGYHEAFKPEKDESSYIEYPEYYLAHVRRFEDAGSSAGSGADDAPRGMFLPLSDIPQFNAYMAYPMD